MIFLVYIPKRTGTTYFLCLFTQHELHTTENLLNFFSFFYTLSNRECTRVLLQDVLNFSSSNESKVDGQYEDWTQFASVYKHSHVTLFPQSPKLCRID